MDKETRFFLKKLELDYGEEKAFKELKELAKEIPWLKGWPKDKKAFWNGEAFMWGNKIGREKREIIRKGLKFLGGKGKKNLDLGCGSYSYLPSTGMDISERMLLMNENLEERVAGDLEGKLPFGRGRFDSATLVFALDYIKNYPKLLAEVFRVLKEKGKLVVVQPRKGVNEWQGRKAVNRFSLKRLGKMLEGTGFKVGFYEKEGLGFFRCEKEKLI